MALEISAVASPMADGPTRDERSLAPRWRLAYRGTYDSYLDPFSPDNDRVVHHVEFGSDPSWTGVDEERPIKLLGDVLTWRGSSVRTADDWWTMHLVWERVVSSASPVSSTWSAGWFRSRSKSA
jgi:hypothetical protein